MEHSQGKYLRGRDTDLIASFSNISYSLSLEKMCKLGECIWKLCASATVGLSFWLLGNSRLEEVSSILVLCTSSN